MNIDITQELLDEVNIYIKQNMVDDMNKVGLSFSAMAFILQTLIKTIDNCQEKLDN